jgi:hypothetical protein
VKTWDFRFFLPLAPSEGGKIDPLISFFEKNLCNTKKPLPQGNLYFPPLEGDRGGGPFFPNLNQSD